MAYTTAKAAEKIGISAHTLVYRNLYIGTPEM